MTIERIVADRKIREVSRKYEAEYGLRRMAKKFEVEKVFAMQGTTNKELRVALKIFIEILYLRPDAAPQVIDQYLKNPKEIKQKAINLNP